MLTYSRSFPNAQIFQVWHAEVVPGAADEVLPAVVEGFMEVAMAPHHMAVLEAEAAVAATEEAIAVVADEDSPHIEQCHAGADIAARIITTSTSRETSQRNSLGLRRP